MKIIPNLLKSAVFLLPGIAFMIYYNVRMEAQRFEPHIYTMTAGKVLVAKIKGDPDITMDTAGVTLHNTSRKLKLSPSYMSARHLEWNQRDTKPKQHWEVYYSKMVPETATGLADIKDTANVRIFYERREKTKIAEILHVGRYENIPESLEKLRLFIDKEGYSLTGFYEEVYRVFEYIEQNPNKYETLLRYQVAM
ncbi:MAG: hypothetical protein HKP41_15355 [Desulfobacterales bacterium]|nr:hypothetical protein [Desulfobacterales bacterium]